MGGSWSKSTTEEMLRNVSEGEGTVIASALRGLVRHALLSSTIDSNGVRIFQIHELLYDYSHALSMQEQQNMHLVQTKWLSSAVRYAERHEVGNQKRYHDALEAELGNLLQAADWATSHGYWSEGDQIALSLCGKSDMISQRGYSSESVRLLQQGVQAAHVLGERHHEGLHLGMLGSTYIDLSDFSGAIEYLERATAIHLELGDRALVCKWTGMIGCAYGDLGFTDKAIEYLSEALAIARQVGDKVQEGFWLGWLGNAYRDKGQYIEAKTNLLAAITILENANHLVGVTMWRGNYARTLAWSGDSKAGLSFCENNPEVADKLKNPRLKGWALLFLSECLWGVRRTAEAYSKALESLAIMEKIADRDGTAEVQHNLGSWYLTEGKVESAQTYLQAAEKLRRLIAHGDLRKTEALLRELETRQL